jgi:hypothetical protein
MGEVAFLEKRWGQDETRQIDWILSGQGYRQEIEEERL